MDSQLKATLTANDQASRVMLEVGQAAKTMFEAVEAAGKEGEQGFKLVDKAAKEAEQGLRDTGDAAKTADQDIRKVGDGAKKSSTDLEGMGESLALIGGALALAGKSAMDQERQIIGLQAAYGDAAAEMIAFADQVASTSIFNDDDILAGERYFASLRTNYDLSIQQIQDLMVTTADLASAAGTSFEDASSRVTAAIRGEGEAAEYLGLTMNQQSIDRNNLTLTMTNQEAAQFRLNALNQQAAVFQGTAQKVAQSSVGTYSALSNKLQDTAQSVGSFIGPIGSMVSGLGLGVAGLAQMGGALGRFSGGMRLATAASLGFVASPLGLTITAIGGALALAGAAFMRHRNEARETAAAWEEAEASSQGLEQQIQSMANSGDIAMSRWADATKDRGDAIISGLTTQLDTMRKAVQAGDPLAGVDGWLDDLALQNVQERLGEAWSITLPDDQREQVRYEAERLYQEMLPTGADKDRLNEAIGSIFSLSENPYVNFEAVQQEVDRIFQAWNDGAYAGNTDAFIADLEALDEQFLATAQTAGVMGDTMAEVMRNMEADWKLDDLRIDGQGQLADDLQRVNQLIAEAGTLGSNLNEAMALGAGSIAETSGGMFDLAATSKLTVEQMEQLWKAQDRVNSVMQTGQVDNDAVIADLEELNRQFAAGEITAEQYVQGWYAIAGGMDEYATHAEQAEAATTALSGALSVLENALGVEADIADLGSSLAEMATETAGAAVEAVNFAEQEKGARQAVQDQRRQHAEENHDRRAQERADRRSDLEAEHEEHRARVEEEKARARELTELYRSISGTDTFAEEWNLAGLGSDANDAAVALMRTGEALETTFRTIVGNTDAIAQQSQGIDDWATKLIGVQGEYAIIDDLLANGRITLDQYNEAQAAQVEIAQSNAEIQQLVQEIQTNQAPLIAEQLDLQEKQLGVISGMSDQQQLVALGWMDVNTATKANEILTMAAAAANGELGAAGLKATEDMIRGAAAADPVLAALLEDMGLITQGADGTITVHMDGAESAMSDLDRLTESIYTLVDVLDDGVINGSVQIETTAALLGIEAVSGALGVLDGTVARVRVETDQPVSIPATPATGDGTGGPPQRVSLSVEPFVPAGKTLNEILRDAGFPLPGESTDPIDVPVESDAEGAIGSLGDVKALAMEVDGTRAFMTVEGDGTRALGAISGAKSALDGVDGDSSLLRVLGDNDNAVSAIRSASATLRGIDGDTSLVSVLGRNSSALSAIREAKGSLNAVDGDTASVAVLGRNGNALAAINEVRRYNGSVLATSYVDIVTRRFSADLGGFKRHGGIPGYASGGVIAELAEAGPEMLHFAGGGSALVPERGIYEVPGNTYVSPANAVDSRSGMIQAEDGSWVPRSYYPQYRDEPERGAPREGDINVSVVVQGTVISDDDLAEKVTGRIVPAIRDAARDRYAGQGVYRG